MDLHFKTGLRDTPDLQLQVCDSCGNVNYPPRELCGECLSDALHWRTVDSRGSVQSLTELQYSLESDYAQHLPWRVASVKLDCGPIALVHLHPQLSLNDDVELTVISDRHGNRMLAAMPPDATSRQSWLESINFREGTP